MVSETLRPSATSPGTSGLVPRYRPPFRVCTRTRMETSSTFARCTCRFTRPSATRSDYSKPCAGEWAMFWRRGEFSGAALFTVLVKGAGFSSARNTARAEKCRIGIEHQGNEIDGRKTRILARCARMRHRKFKTAQRVAHPGWRTGRSLNATFLVCAPSTVLNFGPAYRSPYENAAKDSRVN